jgi:uncharacterized protein YsxB (DUF464 family)
MVSSVERLVTLLEGQAPPTAPVNPEELSLLRTFTRAFRRHRIFALDPTFARLLALLWRRVSAGGADTTPSSPEAHAVFSPSPPVLEHDNGDGSHPAAESSRAKAPPAALSSEVKLRVKTSPAAYVALLTAARVLCRDGRLVDTLDVTEVDVAGVLQLLRAALELRGSAMLHSLQRTPSGRTRRRVGSGSSHHGGDGERIGSARRGATPATKEEVYLTVAVEGMYLLQKLALQERHRTTLVHAGAVPATLEALSEPDPALLHRATLRLAMALSQNGEARDLFCSSGVSSMALSLLESPGSPVRWEAASLLAELCRCQAGRDGAAMMGAVRTCADILGNEREITLHLPAAQILEHLSVDHSEKLRSSGCLPLLAMHLASGFELVHLQPTNAGESGESREAVADAPHAASVKPTQIEEMLGLAAQMEAVVARGRRGSELATAELEPDAPERWNVDMTHIEQLRPLLTTVCAAMTSLARFDVNAVQLQDCNVIFQAGRYIALEGTSKDLRAVQLYAIRLLRFLFSLERNRRHFKRMFPPQLFAAFIDVGHYQFDQKKYRPLVEALNSLTDPERRRLRRAIMVGKPAEKRSSGANAGCTNVRRLIIDLLTCCPGNGCEKGRAAGDW